MPLRIVFDTNILLSGVVFGGTPADCVELARSGQIEGLTCREILDELAEKLGEKFDQSDEDVAETVSELLEFLQVIAIPHELHGACPDPDDDKILECAVIGNATHIVTGDRRHLLPLGSYSGVRIVSARELLLLVTP